MSKTALVTGASSGIGLELARLFANDKHNLVLVARGEAGLAKIAAECRAKGVETTVIAKDLSSREAPQELFEETRRRSLTITFLVNNAGYALYGPFGASSAADDLANMQLNMISLVQLSRLYLDDMLRSGEGRMLNVASTAAFQPGPLMALYYAGKSFVLSFSEAIAYELRGTGVTVTCLCPGPTATAFQSKANVQTIRLVSGALMQASDVARIGYRAMMRGQPVVIAGLRNQLLMLGTKLAPRGIPIASVNYLHQRREG